MAENLEQITYLKKMGVVGDYHALGDPKGLLNLRVDPSGRDGIIPNPVNGNERDSVGVELDGVGFVEYVPGEDAEDDPGGVLLRSADGAGGVVGCFAQEEGETLARADGQHNGFGEGGDKPPRHLDNAADEPPGFGWCGGGRHRINGNGGDGDGCGRERGWRVFGKAVAD